MQDNPKYNSALLSVMRESATREELLSKLEDWWKVIVDLKEQVQILKPTIGIVSFTYLNHRGETSLRRVIPDSLEFVARPGYGYQPGWVLSGQCQDKMQRRSFALSHIKFPEINYNSQLPSLLISLSLDAQLPITK